MRIAKPLSRLKRLGSAAVAKLPEIGSSRLSELKSFGGNPGDLGAYVFIPEGLQGPAPLVVVLHGCTQTAAGYDQGSGWSRLAEREGFILLFPEQKRANNANLCFNWFKVSDTQRGMGEAVSIRNMIASVVKRHPIDPARIFVTGLSAGGAMASVMLATYPELFAAGGIIAGIPYGCATGVSEAFDCMGGRGPTMEELQRNIRLASPHKGPWPRVSVWQGTADHTVVPSNADAIALQWASVHGLSAEPDRTETVDGYPRRVWTGADGREVIEQYAITGMAHGTPLRPGTGEGQLGEAGAHMLDAQISSTELIASFFGIAPKPAPRASKPRTESAAAGADHPFGSVQQTIDNALRAAGLMR